VFSVDAATTDASPSHTPSKAKPETRKAGSGKKQAQMGKYLLSIYVGITSDFVTAKGKPSTASAASASANTSSTSKTADSILHGK
jgi:hypothetical protein